MIVFVLMLGVVLYIAQTWSMANGLKGITFDYNPSANVVEPAQPFEIVSEITNYSRRYIPFIKVEEYLPTDIRVLTPGIVTTADTAGLLAYTYTVYMLPGKKLTRRLAITLDSRGRYFFRGARLKGGDFLGLNENSRRENILREVIVLPKAAQIPELQQVLGGFLGDISVRRFIMEDPVLTTGYREYTGREPMKSISWTQSARIDRLMVKQFDHTIEPSVSVLLNVAYQGEHQSLYIEQCFSMARTVCQNLEDRRIKYDFVTNATAAGAFALWSTVGEGLGERHLKTILEGLGRATYSATHSFIRTASDLTKSMEGNRAVVLITPQSNALDRETLARLREKTAGQLLIINASEMIP